jgi:hypothetical protein
VGGLPGLFLIVGEIVQRGLARLLDPGQCVLVFLDGDRVGVVVPENLIRANSRNEQNQRIIRRDACVLSPAGDDCRQPVPVESRLEVENLFLRHQLNIVLRRAPRRLRLRTSDRTLLVLMTWLWPSLLGLSRVI